ncbi:MAG: M16 family metallopeptidase [Candidatus Bipolaricaulia bacterium]
MEFFEERLPNGLRIIGEIHPEMESVAVGFFVRTGSRDEKPSLSGVSHFLEHMAFKGTGRRNAAEINLEFDGMGAEYNAFTGYEYTVYYARVLPEFLDRVLDLLADMMRPALRRDDFDVEKQVIREEIALYKDRPRQDLYMEALKLYFGPHPLGNLILGTPETIQALTHEQMRRYFQECYSPTNMILGCVGKFDWDQFLHLSEALCNEWEPSEADRRYPDRSQTQGKRILHRPHVNRQNIALLSDGPAYQSEVREAAGLFAAIIGGGENSRLHWALVDTGLTDRAITTYQPFDRTGLFYTYISCEPDRTANVLEIVTQVLAKAATETPEEELRGVKRRAMTGTVIGEETSRGRLFSIGMDLLYGIPYRSTEQEIEAIERHTVQDLRSLAERYPVAEPMVVMLGPQESV